MNVGVRARDPPFTAAGAVQDHDEPPEADRQARAPEAGRPHLDPGGNLTT